MDSARLKLYSLMGSKLLWPLQAKKIANYAAYRLTLPFVRRWGSGRLTFAPVNAAIAVTARCNKECDFCYFKGELNPLNADQLELGLQKFLEMLDHPLISKTLRIIFTGGEPLLNKNIFKMMKAAKERGHIVNLITNGLLLDQAQKHLLENPPHLLTVTYYPEDKKSVSSAIKCFSEKIPLKMNFILSRKRGKYLDNFFRLAIKNNVLMAHIVVMAPSSNQGENQLSLHLKADEYKNLKNQMNQKYAKNLSICWDFIVDPDTPYQSNNCCFFWHSIHVDARGSISPCCHWRLSTYQGNIFKNMDEWNSEYMISLRKKMRNGGLKGICQTCTSRYQDYLGI